MNKTLLLLLIAFSSCKNDKYDRTTTSSKVPTSVKENKLIEDDKEDENSQIRFATAFNGLTMRDAPDLVAGKVGKIPYRESVILLEEHTSAPITISDGGFPINGHFVKIQKEETGEKAYVFDGFLKSTQEIQTIFDRFESQNLHKEIEFQSVYALENGLLGILIPINSGANQIQYTDSKIEHHIYREDREQIEEFLLYQSEYGSIYQTDSLLQIFNSYLGQTYYLHGSNKSTPEAHVVDIGIQLDECSTHFLFLELEIALDVDVDVDVRDYFFATKKAISLNRNKEDLAQKTSEFNYFQSIRYLYSDCVYADDSGYITLIGENNGTYLGYREAALLSCGEYNDPYRMLLRLEKDKIYTDYISFLDIYGCSCL